MHRAIEGNCPLLIKRRPNGYYEATITLPWPEHLKGDGRPYVQTESLFHDVQEAEDWARWMIDYLTEDREDLDATWQPPPDANQGGGLVGI